MLYKESATKCFVNHLEIKPSFFAVFLNLIFAGAPIEALALEGDWAFTGFIGRLTEVDTWQDVFTDTGGVEFTDSNFVAGAFSRDFARFFDRGLGVEIEAQVVRHWGDQEHWEFNLPVVGRWHRFPWDDQLKTTLAFGLGPSYATEVPPVEVKLEGDSERFLAHWFIEITLGRPHARWSFALRLHHRSGAFGLLADEGGSNALTLGIRREF